MNLYGVQEGYSTAIIFLPAFPSPHILLYIPPFSLLHYGLSFSLFAVIYTYVH